MWAFLSAQPGAISVGQKPLSCWNPLLNMHLEGQSRGKPVMLTYRGSATVAPATAALSLGSGTSVGPCGAGERERGGCLGQSLTEEYEGSFFFT